MCRFSGGPEKGVTLTEEGGLNSLMGYYISVQVGVFVYPEEGRWQLD